MLFYILLILLGIFCLFILIGSIIHDWHYDPEGAACAALGADLVFAIIFFAIFLPINCCVMEDKAEKVVVPIVSLRDSESVEASFALGTGCLKGNVYYCYYVKLSNNQFQMGKIGTDGCVIEENSEVSPNLSYDKVTGVPPKWLSPLEGITHYKNMKITVPKGTIIKQLKLE